MIEFEVNLTPTFFNDLIYILSYLKEQFRDSLLNLLIKSFQLQHIYQILLKVSDLRWEHFLCNYTKSRRIEISTPPQQPHKCGTMFGTQRTSLKIFTSLVDE